MRKPTARPTRLEKQLAQPVRFDVGRPTIGPPRGARVATRTVARRTASRQCRRSTPRPTTGPGPLGRGTPMEAGPRPAGQPPLSREGAPCLRRCLRANPRPLRESRPSARPAALHSSGLAATFATSAPRRPAAAGQPLWPPPARVGRRWAAGLKRRNQAAAEPLGRQGGQGRSGLLISASRPASPGAPGLARADLTLPGSRSPGHPPYLFCPGLTRGLGWNGR